MSAKESIRHLPPVTTKPIKDPMSTHAIARRFPPVAVTVFVRGEDDDAKPEKRLNEGINVAAAATFAPVPPGRGEKAWVQIFGAMAFLAAAALFIAVVTFIVIVFTSVFGDGRLEGIFDQPILIATSGLAAALGIPAGVGITALGRRERAARIAAADRALPHLDKAPLRITDSDDDNFTSLRMKLGYARSNAQFSVEREKELLAAIRALGDYRRSPAPDPTGKRMNDAVHLFSDRAVKKLAREFRAAEAAKAAALDRATALVDRFARSVEDENLVAAARKRVAASV